MYEFEICYIYTILKPVLFMSMLLKAGPIGQLFKYKNQKYCFDS